jgi:hypothetical protein
MEDDTENDFDIESLFDGHGINEANPSLEILGVLCVCICGRKFLACIGCLINGDVGCCPDCDEKVSKARLN